MTEKQNQFIQWNVCFHDKKINKNMHSLTKIYTCTV